MSIEKVVMAYFNIWLQHSEAQTY